MRIHEIAKEIGVDNKAVVEYLRKAGVEVKSHMSVCPDDMIEKVRSRFSKSSEEKNPAGEAPKAGGIKAVAVPDFIAKEQPKTVPTRTADGEKVEDGGKQIAKLEAKKAAQEKAKTQEEAPKKKKKIIAVFNPQNSNTEKGRAIAKAQREDQKKTAEKPKRPLPSEVRPARDRVPDGEQKATKKILPSQLRPARDRIPDDVLAEMKAAEEAKKAEEARLAAEAAEKKAAEEAALKEAAQKAEEEKKAAEAKQAAEAEKKAEEKTAAEPAKKPAEPAKAEKTEQKPKESEAIKSLREKIVKGTVNVSDIPIGRGA